MENKKEGRNMSNTKRAFATGFSDGQTWRAENPGAGPVTWDADEALVNALTPWVLARVLGLTAAEYEEQGIAFLAALTAYNEAFREGAYVEAHHVAYPEAARDD
jgi:hypothetical protein